MRCGDTLLIPAPGSDVIPHLWIIVTEPAPETHRCAIVSVTTLRYNKDQTVTLVPGDHPFIRHPSIVFYADAQIVDVRQLRADVLARVAEPREGCSPDLLKCSSSCKPECLRPRLLLRKRSHSADSAGQGEGLPRGGRCKCGGYWMRVVASGCSSQTLGDGSVSGPGVFEAAPLVA